MKKNRPELAAFGLTSPFADPLRSRLFMKFRGLLERTLLLEQLDEVYRHSRDRTGPGSFLASVLEVLNVTYEAVHPERLDIPAAGPLVVVANHPHGGVEGVALADLLRRHRPDTKIMGNYLLGRMPEMREYCIFVDPFEGESARRRNIRPLKECLRWLKDGHALMVFPAGEVSHLQLRGKRVADSRWSPTIAGLIRAARATALPVFIEGRNSAMFQALGLIHPRLRTALLPRETLRRQGSRLRFHIGTPLPFARLEKYETNGELMDFLRLRTYVLQSRGADPSGRRCRRPAPAAAAPLAAPLARELVASDIALLPPDRRLLENGDFAVYIARAVEVPHLIHELGRLREITFRAAGEGSGRPLDLDEFDQRYDQLLLWNRRTCELVGGYRIGRVDEILPRFGKRGLYTSTLFKYKTRLLEKMGPAIELGRSFVRPEYQRGFTPLLMLWKGIARFVARHPRYVNLFGPVSVNNEYHSVSRALMVAFLTANNFKEDLARLVKPRRPPRARAAAGEPEQGARVLRDPDEMSELIAEIEKDGKGIPVLLRQYLKLGGRLLGFNVDPKFSEVLDGLIWVNLLETDRKLVERFMGKAEATTFFAHHRR